MKKVLSMALALCLAFGLAAPALAVEIPGGETAESPEQLLDTKAAPGQGEQDWTGTWMEAADTDWYKEEKTTFSLSTAQQLAGLAKLAYEGNDFTDKTILLDNDVDLAGREWVSISDFCGTFDGQRHKILHLTVTRANAQGYGFFKFLSGAAVQNLGIVDAELVSPQSDGYMYMGILADQLGPKQNGSETKILNCFTTGLVRNGAADGSQDRGKLMGGLAGQCRGGTQVIGCYSSARVESVFPTNENFYSDTIGGLVGQWEASTDEALIQDCYFDGSISCLNVNAGISGILGGIFNYEDHENLILVRNCMTATQDITGPVDENIAWITLLFKGTVENCHWPAGEKYAPVVKLMLTEEWEALPDPDYDPSGSGMAQADFRAAAVLASLNENAFEGVEWVEGKNHPTFVWDTANYPEPGPPIVQDTAVALDKTELELEPGDAAKLKAALTPADATYKYIFWESSDETVATVSDSGLVTAVADGTATITAKSWYGHEAVCAVTVKTPDAPTPPEPIDPWPTEGLAGFVTRCYRVALGRDPDQTGHADWVRWLKDGTVDATSCTYGFVFSKEMNNKKLSDEAFVKTLYRLFMDREGEATGVAFWTNYLQDGHSRLDVFQGFADSVEFGRIKSSYGIR